MAHSRSSRKRWRQSLDRRERNRSVKSRTRTVLNKALAAIGQDASVAEPAVKAAVSALDRAAQKGVIHPNAASRGKSRLLKRFNLATATAVAVAAAAAAEPAVEEKPATAKRRAPAKKPAVAKKTTATKADVAAKKPAATKAKAAKKADAAPAKRVSRSKASDERATEEKPAAEKTPRTRARKTTDTP